MVNISGKAAVGIAIVSVLLVAAYGAAVWSFAVGFWNGGDGDLGDIGDAQKSKFSFTLYGEDTSSAVSSMTVTAWYDSNGDGKMQSTELKLCSDASGVYTSGKEYPINYVDKDGNAHDFDIWVQAYGSSYQTCYAKVSMTGDRNSDGSAKTIEEDVFIRATDDSVTYDGLINRVGWDDSTDYNYTLSGTSGLAEVSIVLSAADKGLSSRIWEGVNYRTIYSDLVNLDDYPEPFWLKWDAVKAGLGDADVLAPDFFGIYFTIQDKIDLAPTVSDFDFYGDDNTNWYGAIVVSNSFGDLMYNSGDSSAPKPTVTFNVGTITAAGTTVATYGVAIHTGLTYEEFTSFKWTASAAYYLGTPGNDWDWVA